MSLIKEALAVAEKYPVFPTDNKKPCWSNRELGVGKGEGGYKIATQDPARVRELFSHRHANEIAVPMGEMSGLICVDVDLYKDPALEQWIKDSAHYLNGTMAHRTRSGGVHFFFKHPGDGIRFPATLRPGVDLKAGGTGYVCFPPTKGYTHADGIRTAKAFPLPMLEEALKAKGGSGRTSIGTAFNDATDEELIESIERADELYPALRSLSFRMPNRKFPDGKPLSEAASTDDVDVLDALLDAGADIEAPGAIFTGGSPMSDAVVFTQWRAARRLLERGATTTLWQAAALGLLNHVQQLSLKTPAPAGDDITNAFWHACRGGQQEVAAYLLRCGADRNWIGHDRKTPLDVAHESGEGDFVEWLLASGAKKADEVR